MHELGPVRLFSEFGPRQSRERRQIAFDNLFGLDRVKINVYAKFYQNISTVQESGPVSLFYIFYLGKASTKL